MITHDTLQALLEYDEILTVLTVLYWLGWLLLAGLVVLGLLHGWHHAGGVSGLYHRRRPDPEWNRRFYPALAVLFMLVAAVIWVLRDLSQGVVPFAS